MCMVLPEVIESVVVKGGEVKVPHDTVAEELKKIAEISGEKSENLAMAIAVYMLFYITLYLCCAVQNISDIILLFCGQFSL